MVNGPAGVAGHPQSRLAEFVFNNSLTSADGLLTASESTRTLFIFGSVGSNILRNLYGVK